MKKSYIGVVILVIVFIGWYLFRPELLVIDSKVNEKFPEVKQAHTDNEAPKPKVLFAGIFHEVAHPAKGTATVYELEKGKHILRFTDFEVSNGPDVVVYLSSVQDANDNDSVKNSKILSLGSIKGNIGNQNYELPSDVDFNIYKSVVIWCKRFGVNFAVAPLKPS